ncbi:MAG TPA: dUTP diphosphatase [Cellvibrionaceae bacterium]|nr:dUTP diphosphatase [Cellvibrionaceae bacterium]
MQQQLIAMLELQDAMNCKVHPQWREQGYAWHRAIWVESAELLEHYGWKWWKKQTPDHDQVALELVDIWHFGLSMQLQSGANPADIAQNLAAGLTAPHGPQDFNAAVEHFVAKTLMQQGFAVAEFARLMQLSHLSFVRLYSLYVGKNILNFFRQDHGYKEGTYKKIWQGREDNEHLIDILARVDVNATDYKEQIYTALNTAFMNG